MTKFKNYLKAISQLNELGNGFNIQWLFYCGMLFSSRDKWWGDWRYRSTPHEGMDICWYRSSAEKKINCFDPEIKIPAMDKGIILNICDDFLGQTIVVEQTDFQTATHFVLYTYAHIIPETNLKKGDTINSSQVIAKVCDTRKNPDLPPHLHFSCFEVPISFHGKTLDWNLFCDPQKTNIIHPFFL
jgi:hypothetical protein